MKIHGSLRRKAWFILESVVLAMDLCWAQLNKLTAVFVFSVFNLDALEY